MNILALLGNRWIQYGLLAVGLVILYFSWTVHEQNLGAFREQAKQQAAQMLQDQKMIAAQSNRLAVAKAAQVKADNELRRYQYAKLHDPDTADWLDTCGRRPLPGRVREYITGVQAASGKPDSADRAATGAR